MNKIEVLSKNKIICDNQYILIDFNKDTININIKKDISEPILLINNIYKKIIINISDDVKANIIEIKNRVSKKDFYYNYFLGKNSNLTINKFYSMFQYNEDLTVNLDGYNAQVLMNLSMMAFDNQTYNLTINHNNLKTISNINNHGVTFDEGIINMIVNGNVHKGMSGSVLNQVNKIIMMGEGKSNIEPNLYIDEEDVTARHGASIGRFNEEALFYLQTRGISIEDGYQLLLKGFLLGNLKVTDDILLNLEDIIKKVGKA